MKLNKIFLALSTAGILAASSSVSAVSLQAGDFYIKYNNWEVTQNDLQDFQYSTFDLSAAATGNGTTDLKGIANVTSIATNATDPAYWNGGDGGEFLWGVFTGFDYLGQDNFGNLSYGGGTFDIYSVTDNLDPFMNVDGVTDAGVGNWIGDTGFTGITDVGILLYSFVVDINNTAALNPTTPAGTTLSTTFGGFGGDGNFYASVTGAGLLDDTIDTNGKNDGNSDIFSKNNWELAVDAENGGVGDGWHDGTTAPCASGTSGLGDDGCKQFGGEWDIISHDPITGAAIPEPAVLSLFGLGLVGLGFARRRRNS